MSSRGNQAVVREFLNEAFDRQNVDIVDEVFASDHVLRSPETGTGEVKGTGVIKRALEDYHTVGSGAGCTILNQIAEDGWVATSYTLGEGQEEHMGVMFSRLVDGMIQETFVVARGVSTAPEGEWEDRKIFN
jgi:hypothetical protein